MHCDKTAGKKVIKRPQGGHTTQPRVSSTAQPWCATLGGSLRGITRRKTPLRADGPVSELMKVMARACGHNHLNKFNQNDITTWKKEMAELTGIKYAGMK
jgi:hypothetical protein